jgi:type I restriction enzyme S subunit
VSDVLQFTAGFAGPATTSLRQAIEYAQTGPFGTQLTADEYVDGGVPVINPTHIQRGHIAPDDSTTVTPKKAEDLARYRLAVGDIVLGRKGEVDKSALVNQQSDGYVCGSDSMALRPRLGTVPDYLWWFLQSSEAHSQLEFWSVGTTVSGLNQNTIRKVRLPLPNVQDQQRIASYLDRETARIDTLIEEQQRLIETLRERRHSVLAHELSGGGPQVPFVRCMTEQVDYRGATPRKTDDGIQLVTARNVKAGWIDYETSREFVDPAEYAEIMHRGLPRIGDLLFTMEAPLGNVAVVDREDIALAQRVIKWSVDRSKAEPRFLMYAALGDDFQEQLLARATGSTALGVKASKLPELRIDLPSLEEQRSTITYLDKQTAKIDTLIAETDRFIELARERRAALITAAVTGEIDVREMV